MYRNSICTLLQAFVLLSVGTFSRPVIAFQVVDGLELVSVAAGPNAGLRPGFLYPVRATVRNNSGSTLEGMLVCKLSDTPSEETTHSVRLNVGESKQYELPLLVPKKLIAASHEIKISLMGISNGREVILERGGKPMVETLKAYYMDESIVVAAAMEPAPRLKPYWAWPRDELYESWELIIGSKVGAGFTRRLLRIEQDGLPDGMNWDVVDCFVVADDAVLSNPANQSMLKRWILGGGRLWVMLDRVRTESVSPLLELDQSIASVGESEIMNGIVETTSSIPITEKDKILDSPVPLKLKRISVVGGTTTHRLQNWPLVSWLPVGRGEILLTTMSPRAWIEPSDLPADTPELNRTDFKLRRWAYDLAPRFYQSRSKLLTDPSMTETDYPLRQIGNPVVSKSIVSSALGGFLALLMGLGAFLWRFGKSSRLGWLAPVLSLLCCIPLVIASFWVRGGIPETNGRLQFIDISVDGSTAKIREATALYLNDAIPMKLQSDLEGQIEPFVNGDTGVRRWHWTDMQKWSWSNSSWPSGLWRADYRYSLPTKDLVATGSLHADGLHLEVPATLTSSLQDPILSFSPSSQAICNPLGDRMWAADPDQVGNGDRWIAGTLITDEQMRRVEIYRSIFEKNKGFESRNRRTLYGFTDLWQGGPTWDHTLINRGTALVSMPIRLIRPEPGSEVLIPHSLMSAEALHDENRRTTAFNADTGRWIKDTPIAATARVRYRVPAEILPFKIDSLSIELMVNAPQRTFTLSRVSENKVTEIVRIEGPSNPWSRTFTDQAELPSPEDGYVDFQLEVSSRTGANAGFEQVVNWGIEYVRVHANGVVLPASNAP